MSERSALQMRGKDLQGIFQEFILELLRSIRTENNNTILRSPKLVIEKSFSITKWGIEQDFIRLSGSDLRVGEVGFKTDQCRSVNKEK